MTATRESHYSINLQWSPDDNCYLVYLPEFADWIEQPCTHGESWYQAVQNATDLLAEIEAVFTRTGQPLPEPASTHSA